MAISLEEIEFSISECMKFPLVPCGGSTQKTRSRRPNLGEFYVERRSHRLTGFDGGGERALVEIIELAPDRHAMGEARDGDVCASELVHQVMCGGLALDRRVQREQHLFDLRIARPLDQLGDAQILGAYAVERRQRAAEHVIKPVEHAGALERPEVSHLLHHTDERAVARRIAAERARALRVDVAANLASEDGVARLGKRRCEGDKQLLLLLDERKRSAPCRTGTKPRQSCQQLDQPLDLRPCCYPRHAMRSFLKTWMAGTNPAMTIRTTPGHNGGIRTA